MNCEQARKIMVASYDGNKVSEAQAMPHRTVVTSARTLSEQEQIDAMLKALMQKVKQDIIAETSEAFHKTV